MGLCFAKDPSVQQPQGGGYVQEYSLHELQAATGHFNQSNFLGAGGFGKVYRGRLHGRDVAVKVLSVGSTQGSKEFMNEIHVFSKLHHKYLVALVGYCTKEKILVYELMEGGSLYDQLHSSGRSKLVTFLQRLNLVLHAAKGLEYMHLGCKPSIIHRDIKSANILLNGPCTQAKIADFGLSRLFPDEQATHVTTAGQGTLGYLDPEYFTMQRLTRKSDVFSFGVVLLEVISGLKPVSKDHTHISTWAGDMAEDELPRLADKRMNANFDRVAFSKLTKLALRCVDSSTEVRPSMNAVVREILEIIELQKMHDQRDSQDSKVGGVAGDEQTGNYVRGDADGSESAPSGSV